MALSLEEQKELENPREEISFKCIYANLDEERLLPARQCDNKLHNQIIASAGMGIHNSIQKRQNVDKLRFERLKKPSFRKINLNKKSNFVDVIDIPKIANAKDFKKFEKFGFNLMPKEFTHSGCYLRPDLNKDALIRGKIFYNSNKFQVHYNMDETDALFLTQLNSQLSTIDKIPMEIFEIIITFFEYELYKLQRILPPTIKDRTTIDIQQYQRAILYGSDDGTGCNPQSEQSCAVCGNSESDNSNSIVFCDGCDIAVHQECYGVSFIPEGPWLCRRCLIARNTTEKCLFCPSTTGAFKQTDGGDWSHVLCTLWIPELYFANPIYMEPIEGLNSIPKSRWKLQCYICQKRTGACLQCSRPSCFQAYHATCAKRAGLYMKLNDIKIAMNNQNSLKSYCDRHSPTNWNKNNDVKNGIQKTRLYFSDLDAGRISNEDSDMVSVSYLEYKELEATQSEMFNWKISSNVYVIPSILLDKLQGLFLENNLPNLNRDILIKFAKYYTLKRQKFGKQLIKKPDVFNHATIPESELAGRQDAVKYFMNETGRLLELARSVENRTKLKLTQTFQGLDTCLKIKYPLQWILCNFISIFKDHIKVKPKYPRRIIRPTINDILELVENGHYNNLEKLTLDIENFRDSFNNYQADFNGKDNIKFALVIWSRRKKIRLKIANQYLSQINDWDENVMRGLQIDENFNLIEQQEVPEQRQRQEKEQKEKHEKKDLEVVKEVSKIHSQIETSQTLKDILIDLVSIFKRHIHFKPSFPKNLPKPDIIEILKSVDQGQYNDLNKLVQDIEEFKEAIMTCKFNFKGKEEVKRALIIWSRYKGSRIKKASHAIQPRLFATRGREAKNGKLDVLKSKATAKRQLRSVTAEFERPASSRTRQRRR